MAPCYGYFCAQKQPFSPTPMALNHEQTISWLKMTFRVHVDHPQPPTFCGFHPSKLPKRTPSPCINANYATARCKLEQSGSKMILDHMRCQNKLF